MITLHSIDLKTISDPCFAEFDRRGIYGCRILHRMPKECGYKCPFFKPKGCRDWIRVGEWVVPPEEYYKQRRQ